MKHSQRVWHGRVWIILSLVIFAVLFMAIYLRPTQKIQNLKIENSN